VYSAPCRDHGDQTQGVAYRPPVKDTAWNLGSASAAWTASGAERLLACRAEADAFLFVVGDGQSTTVYRHDATHGTQVWAGVPSTLPGVTASVPDLGDAPVQDLARTAGGDLVLLLADRTAQPQRLFLARRHGSIWSVGEGFGDATSHERGEVCAGPASRADCPAKGLYGCVPDACPAMPRTLHRGQHTHLGEAALSLDGDHAIVVWNVEDLDAPPAAYAWGQKEAWIAEVPLP